MCGIVGYVGPQSALSVVLEGLRRLEYRGYDSAGVALLDGAGGLLTERKAGALSNLEKQLGETPHEGNTGIGHTRWATHGAPTDRNAHPHTDCAHKIAVIHNGIIENFVHLRAEMEGRGHELTSETDTEVVAHLLEELTAGLENAAAGAGQPEPAEVLAAAMRAVCQRLDGAFTLLAVHADAPDVVVGARRSSPLVVGLGAGETFLASDVSAFIAHTRDAVELGQDQVVVVRPSGYTLTDFAGEPVAGREFRIDWDLAAAEKGGHPYFMLKEIEEQPEAVEDSLRGHLTDGRIVLDEERVDEQVLRDVDKVFVVACGTAYHSGMIAKYAIEHWTRVPVEVEMASEFRYRDPVLDRATLVVAISQSGETADTLQAVRHAREQKATVLAICNTNGAQIPRESDAVLYTRCGPEIGVASTKTFLSQIAASYLVGLGLAQARGTKYEDEVAAEFDKLARMPTLIRQVLGTVEPVRELARELATSKAVLFLGRHLGYPVALEGALKLKELAYMHAEGFPAGELKHGPIALIEEGLPVVVVMPSPRNRAVLHGKVLSNIQEIRARGARTIVIAEEGDTDVRPYANHLIEVPHTPTLLAPLVTTVPLQVFAAELAQARGYDVDKPRNLAKSVTVE
jgi:glucosamine--fructose-6-phosphate aminotransferase (isomerizing)